VLTAFKVNVAPAQSGFGFAVTVGVGAEFITTVVATVGLEHPLSVAATEYVPAEVA
jgi:hypothetical protein